MQNRSGAKKRLFSRECAVSLRGRLRRANRTAAARHPYLGLRGALLRRGAAAPFEKQMVGPPRRRGPKIQARMRRFFTGAAAPRKSDGGGAPSLPWITRGAVAPWCGSTSC